VVVLIVILDGIIVGVSSREKVPRLITRWWRRRKSHPVYVGDVVQRLEYWTVNPGIKVRFLSSPPILIGLDYVFFVSSW
jgi:hypothetical protein